MTRDEFVQALVRFQGLDVVKGYKNESPTECLFQMYADGDARTRTQLVHVQLSDDASFVVAYSVVGACPNDSETLMSLLKENVDGCYTRLAALNDQLVQIYRYQLEELEPLEMAMGFNETARFADFYEKKYFDGADKL